jgi:hypothetical protein
LFTDACGKFYTGHARHKYITDEQIGDDCLHCAKSFLWKVK